MTRKIYLVPALAAGLLAGTLLSPVRAHETERKTEFFKPGVGLARERAEPTGDPSVRPPLYEGLGRLGLAVTTKSEEARRYFDQGLVLAWAFNHAEARRAFREAQRLDPSCAMCFFGEAFVLGPNINDAMRAEAVAPAHAAITRAMALKGSASAKEQALIEALARRYAADPKADRATLDRAWAEAIGAVETRFPDDPDIRVFHADALMNLQPWDYWDADGRTPKGAAATIVATLERALALAPDHPAAAHLYIHAVEASATPERAEAVADRLRGRVPAAGHLVHMPAHIYARIGRHADSLAVNRDAVAADERMLETMGAAASPMYRFGYYPHNVHFLLVAAQNAGAKEDMLAAAAKLDAITSEEVSAELGWVQAIRTAPFTVHALVGDLDGTLALPDPGDRLPLVKGFRHYARGVALARAGRLDEARAEAAALKRLRETGDFKALEAQYVPAPTLLEIAERIVEARIAWKAGDLGSAERSLKAAIALEDGVGYMEPPYWYYPVRQTLGAVQLQAGRSDEAAATFREALLRQRKNGWALWGLMQAEERAGRMEAAAEARAQFEAVWLGDRALLTLDRL